ARHHRARHLQGVPALAGVRPGRRGHLGRRGQLLQPELSGPVQLIAGLLYLVVLVYMIMLITRLVLEWSRAYAREYRPSGLVLFEVVYTLTAPPVKGLRRLIPPIRLGAVALDLSLMILLLLGWVLLAILSGLAL